MHGVLAFLRSFRGRTARVAVYAWLINLGAGGLIFLGSYRLLNWSAGNSLLLEKGDLYGRFTVWLETFHRGGAGFRLLLFQAAVLMLVYGLVSIFFSGGAYGCFLLQRSPRLREFLRRSWDAFVSFLKIFFICWLLWIPLILLCGVVLAVLLGFLRQSGNEALFRWLLLAWGGVSLLLGILSLGVYDFARIFRLGDAPSTWRAFRKGLGFVRRRSGTVILMYFLFLVPCLLIFPLTGVLTANLSSMTLLFPLMQAMIWLRLFFRLALMHGETLLVRPRESARPPQLDDGG